MSGEPQCAVSLWYASSSHRWIFCRTAAASIFDGRPIIHALKVERGTLYISAIEILVGGGFAHKSSKTPQWKAIIFDSGSNGVVCNCRAEDFISVNHEIGQERNELFIPNRPFPLGNGPLVKPYDVFE